LRDLEKQNVANKMKCENEKRAINMKHNQDKMALARKCENEKKQLAGTINCLRRQLQYLKQERDSLLEKYK